MSSNSPFWHSVPFSSLATTTTTSTTTTTGQRHVRPEDLPALVSGKITPSIVSYLVSKVTDTVNHAVASNSRSSSQPVKVHARRKTSDRTALTEFFTYVIQRSGCTLSTLIGALVYISRARSKLLVNHQEFAHHRVFLGALIAASKYLNDASLKNTHWSTCSRFFSTKDIHRIEREFFVVLGWQLAVIEQDLVSECDQMVKAGVLTLPLLPLRQTKKWGSLLEIKEIRAEKERMERRKRTKSAMDMDVDGGEEERKRGRKEMRLVEDYSRLYRIRTPPSGYDSESPISASSSGSSSSRSSPDSAVSISPQTPLQPHSNVYPFPSVYSKPSTYPSPLVQSRALPPFEHGHHRTSSSSISSTASAYQPLKLLEAFPAVPQDLTTTTTATVPARPRTAALPNAPPPLPTLPPLSPYDIPITFSTVHVSAPAAAVTTTSGVSNHARPIAVSKALYYPRPLVKRNLDAYTRLYARSAGATATDLYPSYMPNTSRLSNIPSASAVHV